MYLEAAQFGSQEWRDGSEIEENVAPLRVASTVGAIETESVRFPPDTRIFSWSCAEESMKVGTLVRCPKGEIPPVT